MDLNGHVVLVAGGAGGLGSAVCRRMHARGATVAVVDFDEDAATTLADDLGERAIGIGADLVDEDAARAAVVAAAERGELRHVVATAGGGTQPQRTIGRDGSPHDLDLFRRTLDMNVLTTFNVLRFAASTMSRLDPLDDDGARGSIVLTTSIAGYEGQIGTMAYSTAKGAVTSMTLVAARDLASSGIRVNAIAPGTMGTAAWDTVNPEVRATLEQKVPFPRRFGRPDEFAFATEHLLTNTYVNGHVLRLDGAIRFEPR